MALLALVLTGCNARGREAGVAAPGEGGPELDVIAQAVPDDGSVPLTVQFAAHVRGEAGAVRTHEWDFGDGTTASEPRPAHVYLRAGHYLARLRITDEGGASGADEVEVVVDPGAAPLD